MKWIKSNEIVSKKECIDLLYEVVNQIAGNTLIVEEKDVILPDDKDLNCKIKFEEDAGKTKFSLKIQWANDIPFSEEAEEEKEKEEEKEEEKEDASEVLEGTLNDTLVPEEDVKKED